MTNLTHFRHSQGRVPSGDKLSHIVGLGFPLMWLIAKCREQLSWRESHAVSVESHQSRVRARVSRPYKTKKRRLLECNILIVVPNYFIVKIYHTSSPPCSLDPLPQVVSSIEKVVASITLKSVKKQRRSGRQRLGAAGHRGDGMHCR